MDTLYKYNTVYDIHMYMRVNSIAGRVYETIPLLYIYTPHTYTYLVNIKRIKIHCVSACECARTEHAILTVLNDEKRDSLRTNGCCKRFPSTVLGGNGQGGNLVDNRRRVT